MKTKNPEHFQLAFVHKRGSTQRESLATQKLDSLECVLKPA